MSLLVFASALLAFASPASYPQPSWAQAPRLNIDAKDGDIVSGEHTFRVTVDSNVAVNQVEFYVGSDLRDTETATPYLFAFDTLDEKDGDVKLRFKAYTVENKTAERTLTIHVNNEIDKGAPYHVQKGADLLTDSKWGDAINQGRIALKIDPKSNEARLVLSRANLGLKAFDKAQKFAEDAITQDPNDDAALQLLAGIQVREAFGTFARAGSDSADVINAIREDFKNAVQNRRKSLDLEIDKAGEPSGSNLIHYTDAVLRGERYSAGISALEPVFHKDPKNRPVGDRLAYAQLKSGRTQDALRTLLAMKSAGPIDAYGCALLGLTYTQLSADKDADAAMKDAISSDPDDLGVRTAQAFIALKKNRTGVLGSLATDLAHEQGQRADVNYFLMALADRQQRFGDARKYFQIAVLAEPASPDVFIEQANYSLSLSQAPNVSEGDKAQDYEDAKMYYQTALVARPEAVDALAGVAVVDLLQKNVPEAVRYAEAARNAAPDQGAGHYALAAAYEAARRFDDARSENSLAGRYDKLNLEGREIPSAIGVWRYLITGGRVPVISMPPLPAAGE